MVLLPAKKSAALYRIEKQKEAQRRPFDLPIPLPSVDTQWHTDLTCFDKGEGDAGEGGKPKEGKGERGLPVIGLKRYNQGGGVDEKVGCDHGIKIKSYLKLQKAWGSDPLPSTPLPAFTSPPPSVGLASKKLMIFGGYFTLKSIALEYW